MRHLVRAAPRVRVGLQPQRLGPAGGLWRGVRPLVPGCSRGAAAGVAQRVQAPVGRDLVQPGAHRRLFLEPADPAPGGQQSFLQRVLGVLDRAEDPVAVQLQLAPVRLGELAERIPVAGRARASAVVVTITSSHRPSPGPQRNDTSRAGKSQVNSRLPAASQPAASITTQTWRTRERHEQAGRRDPRPCTPAHGLARSAQRVEACVHDHQQPGQVERQHQAMPGSG